MAGYVPAPAGGGFRPSDMIGALVLVEVLQFQPQQQGSYGAKDAVLVNVRVVDFPREPQRIGESYLGVQLLNVAMVGQLGGMVGQTVLGRFEAVQGKQINPAIRLAEPTRQDMNIADRFLADGNMAPDATQSVPPAQPYPVQPPQRQPVVPGFPSTTPPYPPQYERPQF